jgi:hypothetical protein
MPTDILRKVVIVANHSWNERETNALPELVSKLAVWFGRQVWEDGKIPAHVRLISDRMDYGSDTESLCISGTIVDCPSERQRMWAVLSYARDVLEEADKRVQKIERKPWYRLGRWLGVC